MSVVRACDLTGPAAIKGITTLGNELIARLAHDPWDRIESWLAKEHPQAGVLERVDRMRRPDHDQRADRVHQVVPRRNYEAMGITGAPSHAARAGDSRDRRPRAPRLRR